MKFVNKKLLWSKKLKAETPASKPVAKKFTLMQLEDEDIVNREESFMTKDISKVIEKNIRDVTNTDKNKSDRYSFESPQISKRSIIDLWSVNQSNGYSSSNYQPRGDQEDEIVLEIDENDEVEFVAPSMKGKVISLLHLLLHLSPQSEKLTPK